ncbi:hypothetical protein EDC04DRAFT_2890780 [Pisolithus marmoratus]|nr:hypothetical protein EDC04DRAFT_2890780 [Pisolithus marmoratus]
MDAGKKSRRQIGVYPNSNSSNQPSSRSVAVQAKRQSVMALGSIEHLQHYFTKTVSRCKDDVRAFLFSRVRPHSAHPVHPISSRPFVPAIGGLSLKIDTVVVRYPFPPFVKTYQTDPDAFLPGVIDDLVATTHTTTRAIRSVRNYVIALPDESAGSLRNQYRNKITAGDPVRRNKSRQSTTPDPLSMIRKSALEVLAALRELEERSRVPLMDEAYDAQSDHSVASTNGVSDDEVDSQSFDPDMSISFIRVQGRYDSIPVWEDEFEQGTHLSEEERERPERWDDKLVLGGGWLYKQDIRLEHLRKERDIVQRYVDLVDDVLFEGQKDGKRGWERARERVAKRDREGRGKNRRVSAGDINSFRFPSERPASARRVVSTGMLDPFQAMSLSEEPEEMETLSERESTDEEDLPEWAKRSCLQTIPSALLPEHLRSVLPSPPERSTLLRALSSGQPLCVAYNTGVRRSRKPWGLSVSILFTTSSLEQNAEGVDDKETPDGRLEGPTISGYGLAAIPPSPHHSLCARSSRPHDAHSSGTQCISRAWYTQQSIDTDSAKGPLLHERTTYPL